MCLPLQGADSSSWSLVFPLCNDNSDDNSACPGETQLVSHIGSFANPPGEEDEHVEISLTLVSAVPRSEK